MVDSLLPYSRKSIQGPYHVYFLLGRQYIYSLLRMIRLINDMEYGIEDLLSFTLLEVAGGQCTPWANR